MIFSNGNRNFEAKPVELNDENLANWNEFLDQVTDIPAQIVNRSDSILIAGVSDLPFILTSQDRLPDFADAKATNHVPCNLRVRVSVPESQRGLHLSRLAELSTKTASNDWGNIPEAVFNLSKEATATQEAASAEVELSGTISLYVTTPVTEKGSLERFPFFAKAKYIETGDQRVSFSITSNIMTACPCTMTFTKYELARWADEQGDRLLANKLIEKPSFTHSQRARMTATITLSEPMDCMALLMEAIDRTCTVTKTVLKRPDEHEIVKRSHMNPQFTEDAVQLVVREILSLMKKESQLTQHAIECKASCEAIESIHGHNAIAECSYRFRRAN